MTVSIEVNNVSLEYKIRKKLYLALLRTPVLTGGSIHNSGKGKNVIKALNNISFSLKAGDRLGLIGSNGASKTTLLKVLYGIYAPTSGSVKLNGRVDALFNIRLGFRPEASGRRNIVLRGLTMAGLNTKSMSVWKVLLSLVNLLILLSYR